MVKLECIFLSELARLPVRNRDTDAGYDLFSTAELVVPVGGMVHVPIGIALSTPPGYYYTIDGRSSLWKLGVVPFRGIIDAGYTGPITVALMNLGEIEYRVLVGDKVAQIILHRTVGIRFDLVNNFSPEYNTRGENGFGSSGR